MPVLALVVVPPAATGSGGGDKGKGRPRFERVVAEGAPRAALSRGKEVPPLDPPPRRPLSGLPIARPFG